MSTYRETPIPDNKKPHEYTYHERRAELLKFIIEAGHPDRISRKQMGERYDVDPSIITKDIKLLGEEIGEELNSDAELVLSTLFRKALKELAAEGEWQDAVDVGMDYQEWLFNTGEQEKEPERHEITQDPGEAYLQMMEEVEASESDAEAEE